MKNHPFLSIVAGALLGVSASAQLTPSTNKWAGEYFGNLTSGSAYCEQRLLIDVFVYDDNSVTVTVYDFDFERVTTATGYHARGRIYVFLPEYAYDLRASVGSHKLAGTLKPLIPADCKYSFAALRRWKRGYEP